MPFCQGVQPSSQFPGAYIVFFFKVEQKLRCFAMNCSALQCAVVHYLATVQHPKQPVIHPYTILNTNKHSHGPWLPATA